MDRKQLEKDLQPFIDKCMQSGYPLTNYCLVENDNDFILEIKASWIDELDSCSEVLDVLNDILWDTTSVEIRKEIFAISLLDKDQQSHCFTEIVH